MAAELLKAPRRESARDATVGGQDSHREQLVDRALAAFRRSHPLAQSVLHGERDVATKAPSLILHPTPNTRVDDDGAIGHSLRPRNRVTSLVVFAVRFGRCTANAALPLLQTADAS